jgi:hypothetical protein
MSEERVSLWQIAVKGGTQSVQLGWLTEEQIDQRARHYRTHGFPDAQAQAIEAESETLPPVPEAQAAHDADFAAYEAYLEEYVYALNE